MGLSAVLLIKFIYLHTVEALLTDTLVSGQFYLRPPCLKLNSHTNSVLLHSCKWLRTLSGITNQTFSLFLSSRKQTPKRKSTTSAQYLVLINEPFYIAVRRNDFTVITVPYFNVCLIPQYFLHININCQLGKPPVSGGLRESFS